MSAHLVSLRGDAHVLVLVRQENHSVSLAREASNCPVGMRAPASVSKDVGRREFIQPASKNDSLNKQLVEIALAEKGDSMVC